MKTLVILGVPRAGKTRLSTKVAEQLAKQGFVPCVLPADVVINSLDRCRRTPFWRYVVRPLKHVVPFGNRLSKKRLVKTMIMFVKNFFKVIPDDKVVVFEGAYISPEVALKSFDLNTTKIVVIGYTHVDIKQKMSDIRKYNRGVSPLRKKTDEELYARVKNFIAISNEYKKICEKHGLVFLDTSDDYHGTINSFAENIVNFLSE